jgi:hypothetical protein
MAAVRNKLADMPLADMSDADIIIFVPSTCGSDRLGKSDPTPRVTRGYPPRIE